MKKIILICILLIFALSMIGCKKETPEEPGAPPSPPGMAQQPQGEIISLFCADTEGNKGKDVTLSCTSNTDCTLDKLEAFCSPGGVALPACGPELICDTDNICKAQCSI